MSSVLRFSQSLSVALIRTPTVEHDHRNTRAGPDVPTRNCRGAVWCTDLRECH